MSEYKSYRWNRNAHQHMLALTRFCFISIFPAIAIAFMLQFAILPAYRTEVDYSRLAGIFTCIVVTVWGIVMGLLTFSYWALNETAMTRTNPPALKHHAEKIREIPVKTVFRINGKVEE